MLRTINNGLTIPSIGLIMLNYFSYYYFVNVYYIVFVIDWQVSLSILLRTFILLFYFILLFPHAAHISAETKSTVYFLKSIE